MAVKITKNGVINIQENEPYTNINQDLSNFEIQPAPGFFSEDAGAVSIYEGCVSTHEIYEW